MTPLRKGEVADLPQIMAIIAQAQAYLAAQGIDQWQDGYPDEDTLRADIAARNSYVLVEGAEVLGIATIIFDGEPSYDVICDGAWGSPEPYACIHRIALRADTRGTGVADRLMRGADEVVRARGMHGIRIDTHRENLVMQRMLARNGYSLCGVIYLTGSGEERVALEKTI